MRVWLSCLASGVVFVACAVGPTEAVAASASASASVNDSCHTALLNPYDPPVATSGPLPVSNLDKLNYVYPNDLKRKGLQGRSLIRLKVSAAGEFEAADLLGLEGGPGLDGAMCDLLRRLQWTIITEESQTFVFALRYCLGSCGRVPMYPGFETHEIVINGGSD